MFPYCAYTAPRKGDIPADCGSEWYCRLACGWGCDTPAVCWWDRHTQSRLGVVANLCLQTVRFPPMIGPPIHRYSVNPPLFPNPCRQGRRPRSCIGSTPPACHLNAESFPLPVSRRLRVRVPIMHRFSRRGMGVPGMMACLPCPPYDDEKKNPFFRLSPSRHQYSPRCFVPAPD